MVEDRFESEEKDFSIVIHGLEPWVIEEFLPIGKSQVGG